MPAEWTISQICEAFGLAPSAALRELETMPEGLLSAILRMRAFVAAVQRLDTMRDGETFADVVSSHPMAVEVQQYRAELRRDDWD